MTNLIKHPMRKRWEKGCFVKSIIKNYSVMRKKIKSGPTQIVLIVGHCDMVVRETMTEILVLSTSYVCHPWWFAIWGGTNPGVWATNTIPGRFHPLQGFPLNLESNQKVLSHFSHFSLEILQLGVWVLFTSSIQPHTPFTPRVIFGTKIDFPSFLHPPPSHVSTPWKQTSKKLVHK